MTISFQHVTFQYADGTTALHDLSLDIPTGKKIALLGNNGAGKSTLFQHMNGLLQPTNGTVLYNDVPLDYKRKGLQTLRQKVGIVFQDPDSQLFSGTVEQDIAFGPTNLGWDKKIVKQKVDAVIDLLEIEALRKKPLHFLSLGQKKRVAIAGVLAMEPELMILDEPSAGLDGYYTQQIMQILSTLHTSERTIILSTHDVNFAYEWADEIIVVSDGQLLYQGDPVHLFKHDTILKKAHLDTPWLFETTMALIEKQIIKPLEHFPRSKEALFELLPTWRAAQFV